MVTRTQFQNCMKKKLKGKHFTNARAARAAFKKAAKACGGGKSSTKRRKRRKRR